MTNNDNETYETVLLRDEEGRSLPCYIEQSMMVDEQEFFLLMPMDAPIEIFVWQAEDDSDEDILVDIDDEEIDVLFATARAVLAEQNLTLQRTALTLTASGELPEAEEEDCFTLEIEEDDLNADATTEEFQILATFFHEDEEYAVCTPLEPLLFFAHKNQHNQLELVSPEEFHTIRAQLEEKLFDVLED